MSFLITGSFDGVGDREITDRLARAGTGPRFWMG